MPTPLHNVHLHGWLVIDKPVGASSTGCVTAVKRALRVGGYPKLRVGHGGTLDPLASGVLPVALGEATKLCGRMLEASKAYEFTVRFGEETSTLDAEGEVVARSAIRPTLAQVQAVLPRFTGEIAQVPPAFSALKVDGRRAYDLARAGEEVTLKARRVTVSRLLPLGGDVGRSTTEGSVTPLALRATSPKGEELEELTLAATVSKGTYVRSLARDIAQALGTVGHVTMLRRTKAGPFTLDQAIPLDFLEETAKARRLDGAVLPLAAGLDDIPALPVSPLDAQLLRHGQKLPGPPVQPGLYLATEDNRPVALVEVSGDVLQVVRGFNL
uniref:tRNA pseudouridine(55) synthase TruB n=1 Tax=uncultured Sphingomonas sp. TaxID=158754 RepID=UPI0025FE7071|nr:tRNA pseudouridine(55) synthase TruB [uncultured Sphingomonas sp.]